jgi:type I restriction enzyme R subunit
LFISLKNNQKNLLGFEAFQKGINMGTDDLMENNERFHNLLNNVVTVEYVKNGSTKGINVKLLDVENSENNSF